MTVSPPVPPPIVVAAPRARHGGAYRYLLVASGLVLLCLAFVGDYADWRTRGVGKLPEVIPFGFGIVVAACGCVVGRRSLAAAFAIARGAAWLTALAGVLVVASSPALAAMLVGGGVAMLAIADVRGCDEQRLAAGVVVIGAVYTFALGLVALFDIGASYDIAALASVGTLVGGAMWRFDVARAVPR
jgi:hypothetical protein